MVKKEFKVLADMCGVPENAAEHMIKKLCALKEKMLQLVDQSYLSELEKGKVRTLIMERIEILE